MIREDRVGLEEQGKRGHNMIREDRVGLEEQGK